MGTLDGRLPDTLNEITDLSIPLDPLTDLPFEWNVKGKTVHGKVATLKSPLLSDAIKSQSLPAALIDPDSASSRNLNFEYRLLVK